MARAVRRRIISSTKVKALPESLGQCTLLEELCVPPAACTRGGAGLGLLCGACRARRRAAPSRRSVAVSCGLLRRLPGPTEFTRVRDGAETARAAARLARRSASRTELAALPAVVDWPNLKTLCAPAPRRAASAAAVVARDTATHEGWLPLGLSGRYHYGV